MGDWDLLVERHGPAVLKTVYRLLGDEDGARDCFQETFLQFLETFRTVAVATRAALLKKIAAGRGSIRFAAQRRRRRECWCPIRIQVLAIRRIDRHRNDWRTVGLLLPLVCPGAGRRFLPHTT